MDTLGPHLFACSTEVSLLISNNALRGSKFFVLSLEVPHYLMEKSHYCMNVAGELLAKSFRHSATKVKKLNAFGRHTLDITITRPTWIMLFTACMQYMQI